MSLSAWQIDQMWESETAELWERLNAPDPYEKQLKESAKRMDKCLEAVNTAICHLMDAQSELSETPMEAKVGSLLDAFYALEDDIQSLRDKYERGQRE